MVEVLETGLYSTLQDLGRFGYITYGVPVSGAMDTNASKFANTLVGNNLNDAVMEMTMTGPKLRFSLSTTIAITGADMSPKLNDSPISINRVYAVRKDDKLEFGKLKYGYRSYLAIKGGFLTKNVFGSRSMYKGVTQSERIFKGDVLNIKGLTTKLEDLTNDAQVNNDYLLSKNLLVTKGPEFNELSSFAKNELLSRAFTVSNHNNRMAYQLVEPLENNLKPIITSNVIPGTVQLTPSGKVIILLKDCQTTGGYPRILQLTEDAIACLSQKFVGQKVQFLLKD